MTVGVARNRMHFYRASDEERPNHVRLQVTANGSWGKEGLPPRACLDRRAHSRIFERVSEPVRTVCTCTYAIPPVRNSPSVDSQRHIQAGPRACR